jgi:Ca2+-binding RTX toxin-like protein
MVANDTLLADITGASLVLTNMSAIETAVLRAEGGSNGSIDFGGKGIGPVGGWDSLREVDFTGSASRTLTVNNAPNTGFVDNAGSGTPLVFGLVDFDGAGVAINGSTGGSTDVLNLAIRDSSLSATLTTADWETIRINNQPAADGSFAANTLDMSGLTASTNKTVLEVTGMGGSQLNLTGLKTADLAGGGAAGSFTHNLQVTVVNYDGRLQLTQSGGANVAQVNVQDSSFWLNAVGTNALEIFAKGPVGAALNSTSQVHLNEQTTNNATIHLGGAANSILTVDGIRATAINASNFAGANLFLTAEGTTAGTWTGPTSGAVNFVFTGGGGNDIFNFAANSVDGMDRVFGGLGTDIVSVNITGMGVSGTAMSGGLHFEDTETIRFINTGTAVVDASMMDGNIIMYTGSAPGATTIHGLAGNFDGGTFGGDVTIYADPSAGNATYSNFGAGTQILYGSQAQGVATTFTMGGNLDDTDFIQGWDFDTVTRDALSATFSGGSFAPQIQGVEDLAFAVSGGNTIDAANIVGAMTWTLTGTAALTLNGGVGTPINGANGMIINAGGLSGLFTLDASNTAETITLGSGGSLVNAWGGNDSVTGGSGADTVNGGDGDDTIQGGGAADVLNGGNGNFDTFRLGQLYAGLDGANDTVDGGAGTNDLLDYNGSTAITVIFTGAYSGTVTGTGLGTDSFSGIKQIIGSTGNDTITGFHGYTLTNTSADLSRIYIGNLGNDTIDGGGSENGYFDIAAYDPAAPIGVFVNLGTAGVTVKGQTVATAGTATDITGGSSVGIDTLINIDGVIGTNAADILIGGSDSRGYNGVLFEHLNGFAGNDIIAGNAAALSPTLSPGGTGIVNLLDQDRATYEASTSGVRVHLGLGTAQDGQGGSDLLFDITHVRGSAFNDMLIGGNEQNDYFESFEGRGGDDYINGGTGFDEARYSSAASAINANLATGIVQDGDGGTDVLLSIERIRGSVFDDIMVGSSGNDAFVGFKGNDTIDGGAGFDRVEFGNSTSHVQCKGVDRDPRPPGPDSSTTAGATYETRWSGSRRCAVRSTTTALTGSGLNEFFDGRGGNDTIAGGGGIDGAGYSGAFGAVTVDLNLSVGTATGADGTDDLTGIENIVGSFYSDTLTGDANANRLEGAATKYWTYANTGTTDNDTLTGGAGSDVFVFNSALDATYNVDEITDFVSGTDKIELDDAIFAGLLVGSGSAANFAGNIGAVPADTNDFLLYDTATGALYYDADGNDGGLAVQFAQLTGAPTLSASDFVIA